MADQLSRAIPSTQSGIPFDGETGGTLESNRTSNNPTNNNNINNPVIAVITIQLNENESDNLEIRYHDNPRQLAESFCKRKNLDPELVALLEDNINQDKQIALKELFDHSFITSATATAAAASAATISQPQQIPSQQHKSPSLSPPLPKAQLSQPSQLSPALRPQDQTSSTQLRQSPPPPPVPPATQQPLPLTQSSSSSYSNAPLPPYPSSTMAATTGSTLPPSSSSSSQKKPSFIDPSRSQQKNEELISFNMTQTTGNANSANRAAAINGSATSEISHPAGTYSNSNGQQQVSYDLTSDVSSLQISVPSFLSRSNNGINNITDDFAPPSQSKLYPNSQRSEHSNDAAAAAAPFSHLGNNNYTNNLSRSNPNNHSSSFMNNYNQLQFQQHQQQHSFMRTSSPNENFAQNSSRQYFHNNPINNYARQSSQQSSYLRHLHQPTSSVQLVPMSQQSFQQTQMQQLQQQQQQQQQSIYMDSKYSARSISSSKTRSQSLNKSTADRVHAPSSGYFDNNPNLTFTPFINPLSEKIVEEKFKYERDLNQSTHQRLYEMAFQRQREQRQNSATKQQQSQQQQQLSKSTLHKNRSVTNVNPQTVTERLYTNSSKHLLIKKQELDRLRREKERKELEECTHKPQLNSVSQTLSMQKRSEAGRRIEDELLKSSEVRKMKLSEQKARQISDELRKCTFHPQISHHTPQKSQALESQQYQLSQHRTSSMEGLQNEEPNTQQLQHYELLFENARQRQFMKEMAVSPRKIDKQCTFRPEINDNSKKISSSFFERQVQHRTQKQERQISQLRERQFELTDKQTGQQFFHPQVGRGPLTERKKANMSVTEYLYTQSIQKRQQDMSARMSQELSQQMQLAASAAKMNQNSRRIMHGLEEEKLRQIFEALDSDSDGFINAGSISITSIDAVTLELISPVLYEMEDFGFTLTYPEFSDAVQRLLKTMTTKQRADFFNYSKSKRMHSIDINYPQY